MPRDIAAVIFAVGILGLFLLGRDRKSEVSPALWIPTVWLLIHSSRAVSLWLGIAPLMESPDQILEGNPLDRLIFAALEVAGLMVLLARGRRARTLLPAFGPFWIFLSYCALSILWSDYPLVAFKRWTKALGDPVMVLVVLTDPNPFAAIKRLLARASFLLIPISVLLIKYYPELGRRFHPWSWTTFYHGVATGKNGLGFICMLFGLGSLWLFFEAFKERPQRSGPLIAHGAVLAMALWLFWMADSVTALSCFLLGVGLLLVTTLSGLARKPWAVHLLVGLLVIFTVSVLFFDVGDVGTGLLGAMGRNPTLTGRTEFWAELVTMRGNSWFGVGFESFWLGERARQLWEEHLWRPNQAHNGYLEVFLNLGWVGVALLGLVIAWGYRNMVGALRRESGLGGLRLVFFMVALVYNLTEAAFRGPHVMWIVFLLATTVVPEPPRQGDGIAHHTKPSQMPQLGKLSGGTHRTKT